MLSGHAGLFLRSHLRATKLQEDLAQVSVSSQLPLWIKQTTSTSCRLTFAATGARPVICAEHNGRARGIFPRFHGHPVSASLPFKTSQATRSQGTSEV